MAIRGSLSEAGLSDVLQLLALGQKTGCLSVARAGDFGSIYFERGRIVHAVLVNRRDRLGQSLVRSRRRRRGGRARGARRAGGVSPARAWARCCCGAARSTARRSTGTCACRSRMRSTRSSHGTRARSSSSPTCAPIRATARSRWIPARCSWKARAAPTSGRSSRRRCRAATRSSPASPHRVDPTALDARPVSRAAAAGWPSRRSATLADDAGLGEFEVTRALFDLVRRGLARRIGRSAGPAGAWRRGPCGGASQPRRRRSRARACSTWRRASSAACSSCGRRTSRARLQLGLLALRARAWDQAASVLAEATALPGAPGAVFHGLGLARHRLGQLDDAAMRLRRGGPARARERPAARHRPRGARVRARGARRRTPLAGACARRRRDAAGAPRVASSGGQRRARVGRCRGDGGSAACGRRRASRGGRAAREPRGRHVGGGTSRRGAGGSAARGRERPGSAAGTEGDGRRRLSRPVAWRRPRIATSVP